MEEFLVVMVGVVVVVVVCWRVFGSGDSGSSSS